MMTAGQDCNTTGDETARKVKVLGDALDCRGVFVGDLGIQFKNAKFNSQIISFHFISLLYMHVTV
jgi:hypothetical protein